MLSGRKTLTTRKFEPIAKNMYFIYPVGRFKQMVSKSVWMVKTVKGKKVGISYLCALSQTYFTCSLQSVKVSGQCYIKCQFQPLGTEIKKGPCLYYLETTAIIVWAKNLTTRKLEPRAKLYRIFSQKDDSNKWFQKTYEQ